jgi:hypothetical protein
LFHLARENLTVRQAQEMGYLLYKTIFWYCDFLVVIVKIFPNVFRYRLVVAHKGDTGWWFF